MGLAFVLVAGALAGCDTNGRTLVVEYSEDEPPVIEVGEVGLVEADDLGNISQSWCAETDDNGDPHCVYGNLGTPESGLSGGATFTFLGTGDSVCVMMDPEAVFWDQSISPIEPDLGFAYPDNTQDDGDADLFAGLSSYYTGSPGVELGDFKGFYTDSAGNTVEISYGACSQTGKQGLSTAHAGRGAPEYCTVDTSERAGVEYTVVVQTFSTPQDDGVLSFAAAVVNDTCRHVGVTECTMPAEALDPATGELKPEFVGLEDAFCAGDQAAYCCDHPELCGDDPPADLCEAIAEDG